MGDLYKRYIYIYKLIFRCSLFSRPDQHVCSRITLAVMSRTLLSVCSGHLRLHTESGTVISLRDGSTGRQVQEGPPENSPSNPVPNPVCRACVALLYFILSKKIVHLTFSSAAHLVLRLTYLWLQCNGVHLLTWCSPRHSLREYYHITVGSMTTMSQRIHLAQTPVLVEDGSRSVHVPPGQVPSFPIKTSR